MLPPERNSKLPARWFFYLLAGSLFGGCSFIPTHQVTVDAINGLTSPIGPAYRLADKDPLAVRNAAQHKQVFACVGAALETQGVYEALPGVRPDFIVEVEYGAQRGAGFAGMTGTVALTELYLQLSARRPRTDGSSGKGEEIWNVRTSVTEEQVDLASIMPVLASVAAGYAGHDTQTEKTIKVSEKDPGIVHVKSVVMATH
jgi:cytochrome c551/c552